MKYFYRILLIIAHFSLLQLLVLSNAAMAQTKAPDLTNHFSGANMPLPPSGHPRLFVRKIHISQLKDNFQHEELKPVWDRVMRLAKSNEKKSLTVPADSARGNFDVEVIRTIQAKALVALFENEKETGRAAIDMMSAFFRDVLFPERLDITRRIGETILTGAIVYDWCYEQMTMEEKSAFISSMKKLAATMEIGYPPVKQGSVTGHGSEAQLMRDLLAAGIAVFDEDKEIYQVSAQKFFEDFVPIRNYWYKSEMHHQGDSYGGYRLQWEVFAAIMFDRMGYQNIFVKEQAKVPYRWIYTRRPDGQLLRDGDSFIAAQTPLGTYWSSPFHLMLASNYYKDAHLKAEFLKQYKATLGRYNIDDIWMLLFNDPKVKPQHNPGLPLTKYFDDPSGIMVARTGWDTGIKSPAVVAEMKIGGIWFSNHQHLDAGQFQIYYKGGLAIDAGIYEGTKGAYGSAHDMQYHKRAIAHNTILVFDSSEKFSRGRMQLSNDGGQRIPNHGYEAVRGQDLFEKGYRVAEVLAHYIGTDSIKPDFSYIKGDLTKAYTNKVANFHRSFAFLNLKNDEHPAVMIVYDRLASSNKTFKKTWLLHSMEEPVITGNMTTIRRTEHGYNGKLVNTTLLPTANNVIIDKIGGAARAFEVNGVNYEQYVNRANSSEEAGAWRIELSPKTAALNDRFLNVLQVMDDDERIKPLDVKMIEGKSQFGVMIADRVVFFSKSEYLSGRLDLKIEGKGTSRIKVLVTDLRPGNWQLKKAGGNQSINQDVTSEAGTFYFEGSSGNYSLELKK